MLAVRKLRCNIFEMDTSEHPTGRLGKRWLLAAAVSACICVLWFAYLNRDGCCFYLRGTGAITILAIPWLWLMLMFGFKTTGRMVLLGFTLLGLFFMPNVMRPPATAAAEVSAIARLRELRSDLETYKARQQHSFPEMLPNVRSAFSLRSAYRFQYVPSRSSGGTINGYYIQATPKRRDCGGMRSFTIASDGRLYGTLEERAATTSDARLE